MRWCFMLLTVLCLSLTACSSKEDTPPPGIDQETPDLEIDTGDPVGADDATSSTTTEPKDNPGDSKDASGDATGAGDAKDAGTGKTEGDS